MFNPQKIKESIDKVSRKTGVTLVEYPIQKAVAVYDDFQHITYTDGKRSWYQRVGESPEQFQFTQAEKDWIQNELLMCACSFPYWYFRYYFIKTKEGRIQRPDVLVAQLMFIEILGDINAKNLPMLLLILKARQLGISTIVEGVILWIALFRRGSHTVVASAEEEKSEEMANMVWLALEMLPLWMQPTLTSSDKSRGPEFGNNASDILIQHGMMKKGISRGSTPVAAHLSEVAYYPNPLETIESSLIRAMHENPRTFLALESTARKKGDWFHLTWMKNREGEQTGYNRFVCLFLPWYVGHDKYPTKDFLLNHPIPKDWRPLKETIKQANDARLYVATTPMLKKYMGDKWEMSKDQMWFWEFNFVEAKAGDDKTYKSFLAELAADERSAFQSKKWSVFDQDTLDRLQGEVEKAKYTDYGMMGDGIDEKFALREFQSHSGKRVEIAWMTIENKAMSWKLIPIKETPRDEKLQYFLRVWEKPKPGYRYTVGIDIGSGIGQNRTVYDVFRVGDGQNDPDVQVAQLCSPWISSPESPGFALMLGIWYGQHMSPTPEALMAPEVQIATGDFISDHLSKLGYSNFFYMKRYDQKKHPGQKPTRRGWATVSWSRQMMMETFEHAIKHGWVVVNSEETLGELEGLESEEMDSGKMKYDHADNENSDCYMAGGIAYFTSHDEETIMARMKGKLVPAKPKDEKAEKVELDSTEAMLARHFMREEFEELGLDSEAKDWVF